jgi:heme-degrading monooxygenase HmoA
MREINTGTSRRRFVAGSLASGLVLVMQPVPAQSQNRRPSMEITIRANNGVVTLINIFTVDPENQQRLIELLAEGTETLFSKMAGYISTSFHKGKDGRRVVNYGQWRSVKDIEAFRRKPEIGEYFQRVKALAQYESVECDVAYVHHA